ncbi:MAG: hypothetical protein V4714_14805 [Bacteroidota bacterium]
MALISKKKIPYKIGEPLRAYLRKYDREVDVPVQYSDLKRYDRTVPLYDKKGRDTLWETVYYAQMDTGEIQHNLKSIYAILKADGDLSVMGHLFVERIDLCIYGNTQPFRIRITNKINDNFDYFYVKNADASRVYGLELEDMLSPNRISYLTSQQTLIEEHIAGIPGDQFIKYHLKDASLNEIRLAKEFVKFNERCFVRLLGDMHSSNFVIIMTPDFEEIHYRIRAIDFDQQSYEGRKGIFMPQYFKQNNPIIELGLRRLTPESVKQYQTEERALIAGRLKSAHDRMEELLNVMVKDTISLPANIQKLRRELSQHYHNPAFLQCQTMGEIVKLSLNLILQHAW